MHVFRLLSKLVFCDQLSAALSNPRDCSTIFDTLRYLKAFIHLYSLKIGTLKEQEQPKLVLHRAQCSHPQGSSKQARQHGGKTYRDIMVSPFCLISSLLSAGSLCTLFFRYMI